MARQKRKKSNARIYSYESKDYAYTDVYDRHGTMKRTQTLGVSQLARSVNPVSRDGTKPTGEWLYPTAYDRTFTGFKAPVYRHVTSLPRISWVDGVQVPWNEVTHHHGVDPATMTGISASYSSGKLPAPDSNLRLEAIARLLTKMKGQEINLGVALGEAQTTADYVGKRLGDIGKSYKAAKRGNFAMAMKHLRAGNARKASKAIDKALGRGKPGKKPRRGSRKRPYNAARSIPSQWLEYKYAITPVLKDIEGAIKELERPYRYSEYVSTFKGSSNKSDSHLITRKPSDSSPVKRALGRAQSRIGYFFRCDVIPVNELMQTATRVGLTNLPEVLWEVTPYSFVIDWLVPVGEWAGSMDAANGWEFLSGSETMLREYSVTWHATKEPALKNKALQWLEAHIGPNWDRTKHVKRTPLSGIPSMHRPRLKNPLNLDHLMTGLSLVHSSFFGKGKIPPWIKK